MFIDDNDNGQGRGFCVIDQTVSGIIASSLAQAPTGSVSELRDAIVNVLRASVLPVRGMPPDPTLAVRARFRCLLDLCIADDEYGAKRKFLLFTKLTGDINSESILWHTGDTDPSSDEIEDSWWMCMYEVSTLMSFYFIYLLHLLAIYVLHPRSGARKSRTLCFRT